MTVLSPFCEQGFRQFCKVLGMFVKAPDMTYFWHRGLGACPPPGNFLKRTLRNIVSSVSGNPSISFPGKAGVHSNSLKKVKFLMKMDKIMVWDEGGGMVTTEFLVVYHCESIFYGISKRHKVTEVSNNSCQLDDTNG